MREAPLLYAQNWEDPDLETAALDIQPDDDVVAIAGGGCTVLSLLARGPRRLHAIDRNRAQIQLLLLKLAAVHYLPPDEAAVFLGGLPGTKRREMFESLVEHLPSDTARFWRDRSNKIRRGVISQGRIERYFAVVRWLLRAVQPRRRVDELFSQPTLEAQRRFYRDTWNTPGWRRAFLLGHKRILDRVLDPSFYRYVAARDLPAELHARAERCLTELPIADNYFLSWILRGHYPVAPTGRPPYLQQKSKDALLSFAGRLETHLGDLGAFLQRRPDSSCSKFYLSNVAEWLPENEVAPLFDEIIRVARNGATICYRALMVDRPLPFSVARHLEEDPQRSAMFATRDRAFVNAAFHVVKVRKADGGQDARA
jgi:S-adenosylmethionine-diacylglycerol 3-amino-3-carboxypropyl transferase